MHINISSAIAHDKAFKWFQKYMEKEVSLTLMFNKIEVELHVANLVYDEEEWSDLVEVLVMDEKEGKAGILAAWDLAKTAEGDGNEDDDNDEAGEIYWQYEGDPEVVPQGLPQVEPTNVEMGELFMNMLSPGYWDAGVHDEAR
ncbi:hypothetical protein ID866_11675, partial [Astraeus odoratus]